VRVEVLRLASALWSLGPLINRLNLKLESDTWRSIA
jgi:hypothetical protein